MRYFLIKYTACLNVGVMISMNVYRESTVCRKSYYRDYKRSIDYE